MIVLNKGSDDCEHKWKREKIDNTDSLTFAFHFICTACGRTESTEAIDNKTIQ